MIAPIYYCSNCDKEMVMCELYTEIDHERDETYEFPICHDYNKEVKKTGEHREVTEDDWQIINSKY